MRKLCVMTVLLFVSPGIPGAEQVSEYAEARLVRVPVLLEERDPGGCEGLGPGDIELSEDGQAVTVTHFEPKRLEAVHAVLVDTGPDMLETLHEARESAAAYVESLPHEESTLLATFDDQLVLHAALSTSRQRFHRSLEWIETGHGSRIWDSLDRVIRYLASRPERKVLLLLTDGCETSIRSIRTPEAVVAAATRTESLIVFVVGLNVPARCKQTRENPVRNLELLAERTGGELFLATESSTAMSIMAGIRMRTDRERYITYKPVAFGQGPKDQPSKRDYRWRKRRVRLAGNRPCGISIAGPAERYESPSRRYPRQAAPTADGPLAGSFTLNETGDRLDARLRGSGRPISVLVPPIQQVVRDDASFQATWLRGLAAAPSMEDAGSRRADVPILVEGPALLDMREELAAALALHPDYLAWARERVRERRLREIDGLIAEAADGGAEELRRARKLLEEQQWEPEALELESYLAGWLGDIWGVEALGLAERWLADEVLAGFRAGGVDAARQAARDAERLWSRVRGWLPQEAGPPTVGLLVPGYDPIQEAIGYYRVLLPLPRSARIHSAFTGAPAQQMIRATGGSSDSALHARLRTLNSSEVALGVRLVRWMLEQPPVATELAVLFDLQSVRYAHASTRDLLPLLNQKDLAAGNLDEGYPARQVTVVLTPRDDPDRPLHIGAYFAKNPNDRRDYEMDPVCLVLSPEPRRAAASRLLQALVRIEQASPVPCLLQQARTGAN